ncbi:AMP-binding protein [Amycolatopsis sp. NPDC059027]|uniref:AMP-binding protein n=1 Tax=unclassified Amycolatopsis TaxID=2618356 RepID=UPI00366DC259
MSTFYDIATADPDRIAVIDPAGRQVSFGRLAARVNQLTHALRALGLGVGDGVTVILHNGLPHYEVQLATLQAGMYFTPVNYRSTSGEIGYIVENSESRVVIADADIAAACTSTLDELGIPAERRFSVGNTENWSDYAKWGSEEPETVPENRTSGATMVYTSGTTGRPKGVRRPLSGKPPALHPDYQHVMELLGVSPGTGVHLVPCPLYHAAPGAYSLSALHLGHTVALMSRFDAEETLRLIERYRVTTTHVVPTMLHRLLRLPEEVRTRYDLSSLTSVMHGAAPCPREVKERMLAWLGPIVTEYYGASEGMVSVVQPDEWLAEPGTVGRPLPGVRVKVLGEDGAELPAGETGTLYFSSVHTDLGYHRDPEKTAANRSGEFLTVGDVGYLDAEGRVFLRDRRTDLILSGGVNIYPAEIEARLLSHPDVADVAVIGEPDEEWGQRVVAMVQPGEGVAADDALAERLAAHCRGALAGFKTPRRFEFRDRLPRTDSGKMLRRTLRAE